MTRAIEGTHKPGSPAPLSKPFPERDQTLNFIFERWLSVNSVVWEECPCSRRLARFPQSRSALGKDRDLRGRLTQEPRHQKFDCMREEQWCVKTESIRSVRRSADALMNAFKLEMRSA